MYDANVRSDVVTSMRYIYESNHSDPSQLASPFALRISNNTLLPYDCLCLSCCHNSRDIEFHDMMS